MPTKKSGARKKAEKQKKRQQEANTIRQKMRQDQAVVEDVTTLPGNMEMVCDSCELRQKNRAFCYFCGTVQRLPQCAQCGRTKCMSAGGECLVPHPGRHATGMSMVGAVCDFCEAWVCHSRRCVQEHACACALRSSKDDGASSVVCTECERSVWEHGGQVFRCATCRLWLCQDDQFQHQAMCQTLDQETFKCVSCNKMGQYSCLRCKICFCDIHVHSFMKARTGEIPPCKRCRGALTSVDTLSLSVRQHEYGRHAGGADEGEGFYGFSAPTWASAAAAAAEESKDD